MELNIEQRKDVTDILEKLCEKTYNETNKDKISEEIINAIKLIEKHI